DRRQLLGAARAPRGAGGDARRHAPAGAHPAGCRSRGNTNPWRADGGPHLPKPILVVIGGTPAARTLVSLGRIVGFRTCGVHPGAATADFPGADRVIGDLDLAPLSGETDCWVV